MITDQQQATPPTERVDQPKPLQKTQAVTPASPVTTTTSSGKPTTLAATTTTSSGKPPRPETARVGLLEGRLEALEEELKTLVDRSVADQLTAMQVRRAANT